MNVIPQSIDARAFHRGAHAGQPCRLCGAILSRSFANLGLSPMANSFVASERLDAMEPFYPLHVFTCEVCRLVQLGEFETPQTIFSDYLYFSSYSQSWLQHAERYVARQAERFALGPESLVVEVASNDGYLLQYAQRAGMKVLGIEPAANVAEVAKAKGIPTEVAFFGKATASRLAEAGISADLMVANNVVAHVPDLHDFLEGFRILLRSDGVATFEFPHLLRLMREHQFDTIYHEHFSYFSLMTIEKALAAHGLAVFDVDHLHTHGGSLRIYVKHEACLAHPGTAALQTARAEEERHGLADLATYDRFAATIVDVKCTLLRFLIDAKESGATVVSYGAPAKGNTLLNYCGIKDDLIKFTVDTSPHKQGLFLPGTRIPILHPDAVREAKPDFVLILPWNLEREIVSQMDYVKGWGGRFVVPIPKLKILQ